MIWFIIIYSIIAYLIYIFAMTVTYNPPKVKTFWLSVIWLPFLIWLIYKILTEEE